MATEGGNGRGAQINFAVILAGGPGTSILPIANLRPKLTFPLANEPLIRHMTRFLSANGIAEVAVIGNGQLKDPEIRQQLQVMAEPGVRLMFFDDPGPRGTAGALTQVRGHLDGSPFVVVEGSVLALGVNLAEVVGQHQERRAGMTVLVGDEASSETCVEHISTDGQDRIRAVRVPYESVVDPNGLKCKGIYVFSPDVLDHIPTRGYVDIKEQLIPLLGERGIPVCASRLDGYVRRIGGIGDYFAANGHLLAGGRTLLNGQRGREIGEDVWAAGDARIDPGCLIVGPVLLGPGCQVDRGARIIGPTTLGEGVRVGSNAIVRESILWTGSRILEDARVENSLIGEGCVIPRGRRVKASVVVDSERYGEGMGFLSRLSREGDGTLIHRRGRIKAASRRSFGQWAYLTSKRLLDLCVSLVILAFSAGLLLAMAIAIRLDSPGKVFFRQKRCGRKGRDFLMYKFRTMRQDAEHQQQELVKCKDVDGPMFKVSDDPRVTRVGRFLRRTSLDELPQLINVLKGEMSLVGPRPLIRDEMCCAPNWRDIRLQVKPGITGLWQVHGRGSVTFDDWVRLDTMYVRNQSMVLDLKILLRTVPVVIRGVGAR